MGTKKKTQELSLTEWLIRKIDTPAYRAGTLKGRMHPAVDGKLLDAVGGREALLAQVRELEKDKAFRGQFAAEWRDLGRDIKKLDFSVDIMEELCRRAGVPNPREQQLRRIAQIEELMQASGTECLAAFYSHILERLKRGELVKNVNQERGEDLDDRAYFLCLNGVARNTGPVWKRVFSAALFYPLPPVFGRDSKPIPPSKCFKKKYQTRIFNILKECSPFYREGMTEDELLAAHGIFSYAQTLEWKGPLQYQLEGKCIDTSELPYGTVLNSQSLDHAVPIRIPGVSKIIIIENKANYENMAYKDDTLYIFCHGFFSLKERNFLRHLPEIAEKNVRYLHWGDMDYGGICIFRFIREELFPGLEPWRMGRAEFAKAVELGAGMELYADKREKLEQMEAGPLEELKQCILEKNMEIEQEIFLTERYRKENI